MTGNDTFDVAAFAAALVQIPSCDPPGGELAVAERVARELDTLGIAHQLDVFQPGRANVIARVPGTGGVAPMVFSAHLDTVPVGDLAWAFDPFIGDQVAGRVRGRGASDMKGAVAAFVGAAHRLALRETPLPCEVILAFTAGESANCLGARHLVAQVFQQEIGAFLCGEPSSLDLIVAEKAILWLHAEARGALGHVSGDPGVNAIDLMTAFLTGLRRLDLEQLNLPTHPLLSGPSIQVGTITGGSAVNITPDRCTAELDIRFGPGASPDKVVAALQQVAPEGISLSVSDFKPAVEEAPDSAFSRACQAAIQRVTGRQPNVLGVSYYSDAAILLDGIDAPFAIVGPGDLGMSGQYNETCSAAHINAAVEIYVQIAEHWGSGLTGGTLPTGA